MPGQDDDSPTARTFRERMSSFFLKPPPPGAQPAEVAPPPTLEELEDNNRFADDKERMIGLLAAPLAGLIGILIIDADISHDPPALLAGKPNAAHVAHSLYGELLVVLLVLAVAMLASAWFRKRLYLGFAMAFYGLAVFNLKYWGFGIPFLMFGAWLMVRAYRAQKALKEATGDTGGRRGGGSAPGPSPPRPSKRYTPPTAKPKRPKPEGEQQAG